MNRTPLSIPEIGIIAGTRAALGAGVALLLADRLNNDQRQAIGWTLFAVGVITTVPIFVQLVNSQRETLGDNNHERAPRRTRAREFAPG
jgi:hypothetical protein